jgi:sugar/nucleoside kinase (ribokinase family)
MPELDVYIYGMTVLSTIHLLKDKFPAADGYQEIVQTYVMPGGEAANAAVVLKNLGLSVRLDGCLMGEQTAKPLTEYFTMRGIDCSLMTYRGDFPGWRDIVFSDGASRTVFGWFGNYLFGEERLWTRPSEEAVRAAHYVALDPFFPDGSDHVAELCRQYRTDYVTIDCKWETPMAQDARVLVCSQEFVRNNYPGVDPAWLFEQYRQVCGGLLIFTFGSEGVWYASPSTRRKTLAAYEVKVVDTLAAGDSFRAGVIYGLMHNMPDDEIARFASATAAMVCTRFPSVAEPPTLEEIEGLMGKG